MSVVSFSEDTPRGQIEMGGAALFFDLDGALVSIAERPEEVEAGEACMDMLGRAELALDGRLAVLSGRPVDGVDAILDGAVAHVAGVHGLQQRTRRFGLVAEPPHPGVEAAAEILDALAASRAGLQVERKGASVAIHYRRAAGAADAVVELAERLAADIGLSVQHGAMVVELRTPGPDKGAALRRFMAHPPFAGARPIMFGDDLTDEAAFVEAQLLGGVGVLVGAARPTAAGGRLADPAAVRAWVNGSLARGAFDLAEVVWAG